jgi:hypothetical protein
VTIREGEVMVELMSWDAEGQHVTAEGEEWLASLRRKAERDHARTMRRLHRQAILAPFVGLVVGFPVGFGLAELVEAIL